MRKNDKGAVLLIVLLVLVILIIIIFSYIESITIDSIISSNLKNESSMIWATRGGIELSKAYLVLDDQDEFDSLNEPWAQKIKKNELGDAEVEVVAIDEDRKFNIRACIEGSEDQLKAAKDILIRLIISARNEENSALKSKEIDADEIADNIIEWLNERSGSSQEAVISETSPTIGESDEYENLSEDDRKINKSSPYAILTIAELLMVEGVTRSLLYGPPKKSLKNPEDEEEDELDEEEDTENRKPLLDFITCYSTNIRKININTAPREVLTALTEEMPSEIINGILEARRETEEDLANVDPEEEDEDKASFRVNDIASKSNFSTKIDVEIEDEFWNEIKDWFSVKSEYFSVVATAHAKSGERKTRLKQSWRVFMKRIKKGRAYTLELMIIDREN
ncbi:MAG: general secretion pathway protein GspK [Planctomycetes bacterium]|nr:general secretion pathway protein GspK [Planctomycetota bacterium]